MMYIYEMVTDGDPFTAIFISHMEAAQFLDECDREGYITIITNCYEITADELLRHPAFQVGLARESALEAIRQTTA